jgi:hypothetical protein
MSVLLKSFGVSLLFCGGLPLQQRK